MILEILFLEEFRGPTTAALLLLQISKSPLGVGSKSHPIRSRDLALASILVAQNLQSQMDSRLPVLLIGPKNHLPYSVHLTGSGLCSNAMFRP